MSAAKGSPMRTAALLLLLSVAPLAGAQAPQPAPADLALVREFLAASGAERQYEQMMSIMLDSMRSGLNQGFGDAIRNKQLDDAKRERARAIAERGFLELQRDFSEEIRRVMPYDRLVDDVYGPLYLKQFSAAELREAIAFFRSPTGSKLTGATPQLMQDSSRLLQQRYMPELVRTMNRKMDQRMRSMVEEIGKL